MHSLRIELKILPHALDVYPSGHAPQSGSTWAAGVDLKCLTATVIPPGETIAIRTGIAISIGMPKQDFPPMAAFLLPRSGLGTKKGLILANTIGLIDPDYQGEIVAHVWNSRSDQAHIIEKHERFAQLMFVPFLYPSFDVVEEFSSGSARGEQGFGSTG